MAGANWTVSSNHLFYRQHALHEQLRCRVDMLSQHRLACLALCLPLCLCCCVLRKGIVQSLQGLMIKRWWSNLQWLRQAVDVQRLCPRLTQPRCTGLLQRRQEFGDTHLCMQAASRQPAAHAPLHMCYV
jgi:hypothetical protein